MSFFEGAAFLVVNYLFFKTSLSVVHAGSLIQEAMILVMYYQVFIGFFYGFFIDNITGLKFYINRGDLDWMIMKPIDVQFFISIRFISLGHIISGLVAVPILLLSLIEMGILITFTGFCVSFLYFIISIIDGYSLLTIMTSIAIVLTSSGNIANIACPIIELGKYPRRVFPNTFVFTSMLFLPVIIINNFGINALIGEWNASSLFINTSIMLVLLITTRKLFSYASAKYKSSGS